ncbi:MAG: serine hydrolase domain-containing protein [Bacteroidota bacterium]
MRPIIQKIKDFFAKERILGNHGESRGLVKAHTLLAQLADKGRVPGLSLTVLKEGQVYFQKGYGLANMATGMPMDPKKTSLRIASVSKPITATALALMVSEGIVDLDTSFYRYVPYFPRKKWDFTIRHLASHTAGIRGYRGREFALNRAYSIKESLVVFQEDPLVFEPGKGYLYTSFDFVLLSLAMQEASGIPFADYVKTKVLDPLGMRHTMPESYPKAGEGEIKEAIQAQIAVKSPTGAPGIGYARTRSGFRKATAVNNTYKLAGGGYLSTSEDIAKLGKAYLEAGFLTPGTVGEFLTPQKIRGKSTYYGLGWQISQDSAGRPFYGHIGNSVGAYSNFFVYPKEQVVIALLINCTDPKVQPILDAALDVLLIDP